MKALKALTHTRLSHPKCTQWPVRVLLGPLLPLLLLHPVLLLLL